MRKGRVMRNRIAFGGVIGALLVALSMAHGPRRTVAAPVAQFGDVEVITSSMYVRENRNLDVVGEVANNTGGTVKLVQVTVYFLTDENVSKEDDFSFTELQEIPAGGTSPFSVRTYTPLPGVTHYDINVTYRAAQPTFLHDFDIRLGSIHGNSLGGLDVAGEVRNSGAQDAFSVKIVVGLYDDQGTLIRIAGTIADRTILEVGSVSPWNTFVLIAPPAYASVRLWAEGSAG